MHRLLIAALLGCALAPRALHSQVRPNGHWRQIESNHFRVVYERGLDSIARHAAARAELEHARLSAGLVRGPAHKIDIIIGDNTDITNGFATPFPDNRITLFARPPIENLSLQYYDDWIDLVVTHELTHIFHMEQSGRVGRALRSVFGRVPFGWPVFPVVGLPRWNLEGLAVLIESQHTGVGRLEGSYHEMVVRTDVLEHRFQTIDRVSGETPIWPGGDRAYIYGSLFMEYIARHYGEAAHTALIAKTAGSVLPPEWRLDAIARKATGRSYSELYDDWRAELDRTYQPLADSLRRDGLTQPERLTNSGRYAWYPRVSPDSKRLAYADENGRDVPATRIIDLQSREATRIRRNGFGPVAWLPDGNSYITAQYELISPYDIFTDLYLVKDGVETRLTFGERAETPDISRDGTQLVYVQNVHGTNRLMLRAMRTGVARVLVAASPDAQWQLPRFSPDGKHIAVQRWTRAHGIDIAIVDLNGAVTSTIRTDGIDAAPVWSADGKFVLFTSDRSGITNIYAADGDVLRQVTNVLGGAFYPDVSPDGRWIYYSGYHADGFHIERIAFDTKTWRAPAPVASPAIARPDTVRTPAAHYDDVVISKPHTYWATRSALPKFWLPDVYGDTAFGTFFGVTTSGADDINRHAYTLSLAVDNHGRTAGDLDYTYAGLGNPLVNLNATRNWDYTGLVAIRDTAGALVDREKSYEREDRVSLNLTLLQSHWRQGASFLLGVEGVEFNRGLLGMHRFRDARDKLVGLRVGAGFSNTRSPQYAISREDGVRASVGVRRRFDVDPSQFNDASYSEYAAAASGYKSVDAFGFAHQVMALRASALLRTGTGVGPTDVGGTGGLLPVRGYDGPERIGYRAWTASAEYRVPVALVGRGHQLWPFFLDRFAIAGFFDAGNASCTAEQRAIYLSCPGNTYRATQILASAGVELNAAVAVLQFFPAWVRIGVAQQFSDAKKPQLYITLSPAF